MDAINNKSVAEASLRTARRKYISLKTALQKTDDPEFGRYDRYGQDVLPGRLLFLPQSARCVRCAGI